MKINRVVGGFLWLAVFVAAFYVAPRWFSAGQVPKPPAFDAGLTLTSAKEAARGNAKPVLVFATADWCPPCKQMKKSTLLNDNVARMIRDDFNSVYLDTDRNPADGGTLNVFSLPTTIVMVGDQELARVEGYLDTDSYLSWLEAAWAQAQSGVIPPRTRDLKPGDTPRPPVGSETPTAP